MSAGQSHKPSLWLASIQLVLLKMLVMGLCLSGAPLGQAADDPAVLKLEPKCGLPFQDSAVLQQKMPVPVRGTSLPGAKVTVRFGEQKKPRMRMTEETLESCSIR